MATPQCIVWATNLIYAAYGRQVDQAMLEAYTLALRDRSDWQVQRAVTSELPRLSKYPIDAGALNLAAAKFKRSEADEIAAEAAERERLMLPAPKVDGDQFAANRKVIYDELKGMIASGEFGQDAPDSFSREMLKVLETCDGDPAAEVYKVLFKVRRREAVKREVPVVEIQSAIARADQWGERPTPAREYHA